MKTSRNTFALLCLVIATAASSAKATILVTTVDGVSDLQSGTYIAAGNPGGSAVTVGPNTFAADPQTGFPVTFGGATINGLSFGGNGDPSPNPNTGDASINSLLDGYIYGFTSLTLDVSSLTSGTYGVDLLFYSNGSNTLNLNVEGETTTFDPFSNSTAFGVLIHAEVPVTDGTLNVIISGSPFASQLNAFSVVASVPEPSTYAMLLGGVGVLLWRARAARRSRIA